MPGVRYGLDITDDADMLRRAIGSLRKERRSKGKLSQRRQAELKRYLRAVKAGFGNEKILNEYSKYSRRRMGYDPSGRSRTIAGVTERARPAIPNYRALDKRRREASGVKLEEIRGNTVSRIVKLAEARKREAKRNTEAAKKKRAAARKRANKKRRQKRAAAKKAAPRKRQAPRKRAAR